MGRLVKGYWDCKYCGQKAIDGPRRECPSCGVARDKDTKFYMNLKKIEYVSEESSTTSRNNHEFEEKPNREPNWICDYCSTLNSSYTSRCASCGSKRNENSKTYSNYNHTSIPGYEASFEKTISQASKSTHASYNKPDDSFSSNNINKKEKTNTTSNFIRLISDNVGKISIILVSILAIIGLIFLLSPKYYDVTIQDFSWERNIYIEKLKTVDESDWTLPTGARLHRTNVELYGYEQVLDHYETKTRTVTRSKYVGEEYYVSGYRDLGNGYFEEVTSSRPIYESYQDTETYQDPVYRDEPIYKTKYYYEIDKWFHERTVTTGNSDKNPFWGDVILEDKERVSSKDEKYYITALHHTSKKQEITKYSMSHEQWNMLEIGEFVKLKVTLGFAQIVFEE